MKCTHRRLYNIHCAKFLPQPLMDVQNELMSPPPLVFFFTYYLTFYISHIFQLNFSQLPYSCSCQLFLLLSVPWVVPLVLLLLIMRTITLLFSSVFTLKLSRLLLIKILLIVVLRKVKYNFPHSLRVCLSSILSYKY